MVEERGTAAGPDAEGEASPAMPLPLRIVIARIIVVSGIGVAGALAIFLLVGGLWVPGLAAGGATFLFLFLMFAIERNAER